MEGGKEGRGREGEKEGEAMFGEISFLLSWSAKRNSIWSNPTIDDGQMKIGYEINLTLKIESRQNLQETD